MRLLDGGWSAWSAAGLPTTTDAADPTPGAVALEYGHLPVLDIDEAAALPEHGMLIDARAAERFRGDVEPIDPRAGHIPGAVNAPSADNLGPDGRFLSPARLVERFASLGVDSEHPVGVYCGSGVTAAHDALALTIAGFEPALYPGSWSQWSNHPDRPAATGATASPSPPAPTRK